MTRTPDASARALVVALIGGLAVWIGLAALILA